MVDRVPFCLDEERFNVDPRMIEAYTDWKQKAQALHEHGMNCEECQWICLRTTTEYELWARYGNGPRPLIKERCEVGERLSFQEERARFRKWEVFHIICRELEAERG